MHSKKMTPYKKRILMFSPRNIVPSIFARCMLYEFEDIIREIDAVTMLAPKPTKFYKYGDRIANRMAHASAIAMNPGIPSSRIEGEYSLMFVMCEFAKDLLLMNSLKGWKERCATSVCWIDELLLNEMMNWKCFAKLIGQFDHVILSCRQGMEAVSSLIRGKCIFMPPAVDALLFSPYPNPQDRCVDVLSIGRKAEATHLKLVSMAKENKLFYVHDSSDGRRAVDPGQHRLLYANLAKRSKYFLVNPGKIDLPQFIGSEELIGTRYFEGAASGSVMIGKCPDNDDFRKCFGWLNPVVELPYNSDDIDKVIQAMDMQGERLAEIRKNNIVGALRNHDWVHRWEVVLNLAELDPLPALSERKKRLEELAVMAEKN